MLRLIELGGSLDGVSRHDVSCHVSPRSRETARVCELPEQSCERFEIGFCPVLEKTVEPLPAGFDDAVECPATGGGEVNDRGTPIARVRVAPHEPFALELLDLAGDGRGVHSEQVRECRHP